MSVDVFDGIHFFQEAGKLLDVPPVDVGDFIHHRFLVAMMGQVVMALGDLDIRECSVASLVGQQEGGDASGIGLERQDHHVEHERDMLVERGRNAGRSFHGRIGEILELFGLFQATFDFPNARKIFIELLLILAAKLSLERASVVANKVKDRALLLATEFQVLLALAWGSGTKETLEHEPRIGLG